MNTYLTNMVKDIIREQTETNLITEIVKESFGNTILGSDQNFIRKSTELLKKNNICEFYENLYESLEKLDDLDETLLETCVLTFSQENQKLGSSVTTFSLPAGWTCPFAHKCLKKVNRYRVMDPEKEGEGKISKRTGEFVPDKGKVVTQTGPEAEFDCFAANQEMQYDAVRENRWRNFDLLKIAGKKGGAEAQADLITNSLNYFFENEGATDEVRIHESGDFYNGEYLKAWLIVCKRMPKIKFYAYTKSIPFVKNLQKFIEKIPNFSLTLSRGGRRDDMIGDVNIKSAGVYNTPEEALKAGMQVDLDDFLAKQKGGKEKDFGHIVHGTQKKGEMSQNKMRNETFNAFWKYRKVLNKFFDLPDNHIMSPDEGVKFREQVDSVLSNQDSDKKQRFVNFNSRSVQLVYLRWIKKLLNYVVKYHKYNFSDSLIAILPDKFKP